LREDGHNNIYDEYGNEAMDIVEESEEFNIKQLVHYNSYTKKKVTIRLLLNHAMTTLKWKRFQRRVRKREPGAKGENKSCFAYDFRLYINSRCHQCKHESTQGTLKSKKNPRWKEKKSYSQ
jgi:hypothetical protein